MQPKTQQSNEEQQGFYRPTQVAPFETTQFENAPDDVPLIDPNKVVSWEASEYIHRNKDTTWIISFIVVVAIIVGVTIYVQAWTFMALVVAMAIAFGVFAFRTPKTKTYTLTHQGLKIDDQIYHLTDFRAFGILAEDAFFSIVLIPIKRFMPSISVYFAQDDGEQIVDILGAHLPLQDIEPDPIDALMRRLHF